MSSFISKLLQLVQSIDIFYKTMYYICKNSQYYNCKIKGGKILKNKFNVSEAELEILKILWIKNNLTSKEIVEELVNKTDWKPKTIQTLITRLVEKGALSVDKSNKKGYIFSSNINEDEYKSVANESFINKLYNGSLNLMISTFIKENKLTKKDIDDLKNLLDEDN